MAKGENDLLLAIGGLAIAYFGIIKPLTNKLGLTQSAKDKALSDAADLASGSNGWNPNFYHDYTASHPKWTLLTAQSAINVATNIYNAWGLFNDNESAIYTAFRSLKSQLMLSQVTEQYKLLFNRDLVSDLKAPWYYLHDGLDDAEFQIVAGIVNALPVNIITS